MHQCLCDFPKRRTGCVFLEAENAYLSERVIGYFHLYNLFYLTEADIGRTTDTNLIGGRVEAQQVTVAALQACLSIAAVHVLCGCTFQHRRQENVWGGVLQVKDTGGPATPRGLVKGD